MEKVAKIIEPIFEDTLKLYDFSKYPSTYYDQAKLQFPKLKVNDELIERSLLWKWGHAKKANYPQRHRDLISEIQRLWPKFTDNTLSADPKVTFNWWTKNLEKRTRYITVAYLTHLIHHQENIPIIDQHNFRAMNDLLNKAQGSSFSKKKPSNWNDILALKTFMLSLQEFFPQYSFAELDRFLMMFGRYHAVR